MIHFELMQSLAAIGGLFLTVFGLYSLKNALRFYLRNSR